MDTLDDDEAPLDFDRWLEISVQLLKRDPEERAAILDEHAIESTIWEECDAHHGRSLGAEVARGDLTRAKRYGARCAEELARRAATPEPALVSVVKAATPPPRAPKPPAVEAKAAPLLPVPPVLLVPPRPPVAPVPPAPPVSLVVPSSPAVSPWARHAEVPTPPVAHSHGPAVAPPVAVTPPVAITPPAPVAQPDLEDSPAERTVAVSVPVREALPFQEKVPPARALENALAHAKAEQRAPTRDRSGETVDVGAVLKTPLPFQGRPAAAPPRPAPAPTPKNDDEEENRTISLDVPVKKPLPFQQGALTPAQALENARVHAAARGKPEPADEDDEREETIDIGAVMSAALPFAAKAPPSHTGAAELTVEQYASLCVEVDVRPDRLAETLRRYRLTGPDKARIDGQWKARLASEPSLHAAFGRAYATYKASFTAATATAPGGAGRGGVELTVEQYAAICAELSTDAGKAAGLLARYGIVGAEVWAAVRREWDARLGADLTLRMRWMGLVAERGKALKRK